MVAAAARAALRDVGPEARHPARRRAEVVEGPYREAAPGLDAAMSAPAPTRERRPARGGAQRQANGETSTIESSAAGLRRQGPRARPLPLGREDVAPRHGSSRAG